MALSHDFPPVQSPNNRNDVISRYICHCFDELNDLLKRGEKVPIIKIVKKICHLIDAGGPANVPFAALKAALTNLVRVGLVVGTFFASSLVMVAPLK